MAGGKNLPPVCYFQHPGKKMTENNLLLTELNEHVLTLTLNRPKVNAFNLELITALQRAFKQAESDPQARCILLTGSGVVFSAGQDISEFRKVEPSHSSAGKSPAEELRASRLSYRKHLQKSYNPLILQIRRLGKPVLAAIQGAVSGAGLGPARIPTRCW